MSTAVEKRMLSPEEIEAQTALVLPERELMWHHKHHHHHHHKHVETITIICFGNEHHFDHHGEHMGQWDGQNNPWQNNGNEWMGNFNDHNFNDRFNQNCVILTDGVFHPFN